MAFWKSGGTRGVLALGLIFLVWAVSARRWGRGQIPTYGGDGAPASMVGDQTAVIAGGCFWGVDGVFKHVKGVRRVVSGYSGGDAAAANYESVSTGTTGHAESVQIAFDPAQVSYGDLLRVFFSVAHDPTELNRQGPDGGPQYRSAIFYANEQQRQIAAAYIDQLNRKNVFHGPIVTQVLPLKAFYPAEAYHQDYLERHSNSPYILFYDLPKLRTLKKEYPLLYRP